MPSGRSVTTHREQVILVTVTVTELKSPLGRILQRRAEVQVAAALLDTRVVVVNGARQSGKSTLVRLVVQAEQRVDGPATWRTLDDERTLEAAVADPSGFVDTDDLLVIDEIQRAPRLLLAMKERVDRDPRPGRYLVTGSARVLGLRALPDALPGRTETIELWPFSQGEMDGAPDGFVDSAFATGPAMRHESGLRRRDYIERVVRGGFPESLARPSPERRQRFLQSYVEDIIVRDVAAMSDIEQVPAMRALIRLVAARSGQLLVESTLASGVGLSQKTIGRYIDLLEEVFLIKRIPAWSRNLSARALSTPKVAIVDSGLAADLLDLDADYLAEPTAPLGLLLEGFVLMELARQLTWSTRRARLYHYRTRDGVEVDAVLEDRRGRVVAIEVKASSTVRNDDFRGLRHLAERLGDDFVLGVVLYTGPETLPFGPKIRAMPVSALWEVGLPQS